MEEFTYYFWASLQLVLFQQELGLTGRRASIMHSLIDDLKLPVKFGQTWPKSLIYTAM
jgi:hypothetical protein